MWPILFHVGQNVPSMFFLPLLGLSWGSLGSLEPLLGLSWAVLGQSWGRKTAQSRPKAGVPPKSLKSSPLPHGSSIFVPSWGSLWALLGLSWALLGVSWALLGLSWGFLGSSVVSRGLTFAFLKLSWAIPGALGLSWALLALSWVSLGAL